VAHNPQANEYLVAWIADGLATDDEFELFGQRLSGAGAELGGDFRISTTGADGDTNLQVGDPALAHNPEAGEYLVVWEAAGLATVNGLEVFGQRLTAVGAEIGGDFRISTTGTDGDADREVEDPVVAYNPQAAEYLVAWEADGLATDNESEVFGQGLSGAGAELGGQFRISTTGADGDTNREVEEPAMAYNPQRNEYLVAWQADALATDNEFEILARRSGAGAPPPPGTTEPAPPPSDTTEPLLSALSLSPARFRAAASGPSIAARVGSRVSYRLSEAAAVLFRVEQARPGRRAGGRCVKPRRSNRRARRCIRYVTLRGSFSHQGGAGANGLRFRGRLRARKLRPGRYRLRAVATDAAGNRSRGAAGSVQDREEVTRPAPRIGTAIRGCRIGRRVTYMRRPAERAGGPGSFGSPGRGPGRRSAPRFPDWDRTRPRGAGSLLPRRRASVRENVPFAGRTGQRPRHQNTRPSAGPQKDFGSDRPESACKQGVLLGTADDRPAASPESVRPDAEELSDCPSKKDLQMQAFSEAAEGIRTLDLLHGKQNGQR
jgi:hypothetical protein